MSPFPADLLAEAAHFVEHARAHGLRVVTAESCTGGLVAALLTEIAGSSDVLDRGFVTYANAAKSESLGVAAELIAEHGAVSAPVARAMAEGALANAHAQLAIAVTGVAGPGGGSAQKPVGLVHFATARKRGPTRAHLERYGDLGRPEVRLAAVRTALRLLCGRLAD